MGVTVSSSHVVSAASSSSGGGLLTLLPCSIVRSLSRETVLHKLLQQESFPRAAALHKLHQRGSFPRGAVLQEQAAPAWVPAGSQALPANQLRRGLLFPRVHRSWQEPAPAQAPHRVTASFRHPPAPAWGPFHGLQVGICSTVDLHRLQGDSLPHHGLHHELQGRLSALTFRAPPPPPSSLILVSAELFLPQCLTPLPCSFTPEFFYFSFLTVLSQRHYHHR